MTLVTILISNAESHSDWCYCLRFSVYNSIRSYRWQLFRFYALTVLSSHCVWTQNTHCTLDVYLDITFIFFFLFSFRFYFCRWFFLRARSPHVMFNTPNTTCYRCPPFNVFVLVVPFLYVFICVFVCEMFCSVRFTVHSELDFSLSDDFFHWMFISHSLMFARIGRCWLADALAFSRFLF